jgi:hypothetical protein
MKNDSLKLKTSTQKSTPKKDFLKGFFVPLAIFIIPSFFFGTIITFVASGLSVLVAIRFLIKKQKFIALGLFSFAVFFNYIYPFVLFALIGHLAFLSGATDF